VRLWSIHPRYLDSKGLVALWREGLLALAVLEGKTRGYKRHPQLERFLAAGNPVTAITCYLWAVYDEAEKRGYNFKPEKLGRRRKCKALPVTDGQLQYELEHLKDKLKTRDPVRHEAIRRLRDPESHPAFLRTRGGIECWERIRGRIA
jgi:hypothetical protein